MRRTRRLALITCLAAATANPAIAQQPGAPTPAIAAAPNPVPADLKIHGTTITWSTANGSDGVVRVSVNGGAEQVFAQGSAGSSPADWIDASSVYEFRLYYAHEPTRVLARVKVSRDQSGRPQIEISPNPVPPGSGLASTRVSWTTGDQTDGEVYVSRGAEPERLFAKGPSGSAEAAWIDRASTYEFKLYAMAPSKRLLASVTLTPALPPPMAAPGDAPTASQNLSAYLLWAAVIVLFVVAFLRRRRKPDTTQGS